MRVSVDFPLPMFPAMAMYIILVVRSVLLASNYACMRAKVAFFFIFPSICLVILIIFSTFAAQTIN
jgi:hypothetical protein